MEKNINTRTIVAQSIVTLRGVPLLELFENNRMFSNKFNLYSEGRKMLDSYPSKSDWDERNLTKWREENEKKKRKRKRTLRGNR